MSGARIKQKLANGERVVGMFIQFTTNPAFVEALPDHGLDFVVVTEEHNALDMADFLPLRFALAAKGIACLVRVPGRDPDRVAKACDAFPDGVVVPYVEDPDEVLALVGAAKYRPLKGQALERLLATGEYPSEATRQWIETKCANTVFAAMVESVRALENLDAICATPGVDAVFVGPNDLTVSMGIPEERDHPDFVAAMQRIIDTAESHGVVAGAHFSKLEHAQRLIEQGGRFIPFSSDVRLIEAGVPAFLKALGADPAGGREQII